LKIQQGPMLYPLFFNVSNVSALMMIQTIIITIRIELFIQFQISCILWFLYNYFFLLFCVFSHFFVIFSFCGTVQITALVVASSIIG